MQKKKFESKTQMILFFLKGSKKYFFVAIVSACLVSLMDMVNPKIISYTVDTILGDKVVALPSFLQNFVNQMGGISWFKENLWAIALAVVFVAMIGALCRFVFNLFNTKGAEKLVHTMRNELFNHILHLPFHLPYRNQNRRLLFLLHNTCSPPMYRQ